MSEKIENNNERLQKIVNMAKNGTEFERRNAMTILEKICLANDLILEDILDIENKQKYELAYKGKLPIEVAAQIVDKIIGDNVTISFNKYRGVLMFKCSKQKYIELETAFDAYYRGYIDEKKRIEKRHRQEKKALALAFIMKHHIYDDSAERKENARKVTEAELRKMEKARRMAGEMEDIHIQKQIEG